MELVASLFCLKNIVGLVGIDCPISPAILPAESAKLSPIILRPQSAKSTYIPARSIVYGDASKIINGVGVAEDNISVSICVLLCGVHSVAVAVDEGEVAALVDSTHGIIGEHPRLRLLHNQFDIFYAIIGVITSHTAPTIFRHIVNPFIVVAPEEYPFIPELEELSNELLPTIPIFLKARCLLLIACPFSYRSEVPEVAYANDEIGLVFFRESEQSLYRGGILFIAVDITTSNELYWLH